MDPINVVHVMWISFLAGFTVCFIGMHYFWSRWLVSSPERFMGYFTYLLEFGAVQVFGIQGIWVKDIEQTLRYVTIPVIRDVLMRVMTQRAASGNINMKWPPPPPDGGTTGTFKSAA